MKTWKHVIIGIIAVITLAFAFIACATDNKPNNNKLFTPSIWKYAAKGGNKGETFTFSGSDDPKAVAWYNRNGGSDAKDAGTKTSNELCLYDMNGNVFDRSKLW